MTGDTSRCDYYKKHSQNVEDKYECISNIADLPVEVRSDLGLLEKTFKHKKPIPQTEQECKVSFYYRTLSLLRTSDTAQ